MRYTELALSAQTAYAELLEQTRTLELTNALAGLVGSFHKLTRKGRDYWYFAYRDLGQNVRMAYAGPDDKRVRSRWWSVSDETGEKSLLRPWRRWPLDSAARRPLPSTSASFGAWRSAASTGRAAKASAEAVCGLWRGGI
ncbi:MAG: hypothetical protein A3H32_08690 [Betaproteobacteria bacterium RIFCSPLOWO2_02_FULL_63_19]|nr:MAG: hypothetical protein A3H32_08690 [Betaproteobacteria bacterium RIFCSPLOWO2_02_FULL_63_19]